MNQITISLYPHYLTNCDTSLLDAVLKGLLPRNGKISEGFMGCLGIEFFDESGTDIDERPPVLIPGFVDFARKLLSNHPDFVYVTDLSDPFFENALMAVSGNITAIQRGDQGVIYASGGAFFKRASEELERFEEFALKRTDCAEFSRVSHALDLREYLHLI